MTHRNVRPHVIIGHDIHDTGFDDALGVVETHAVRRASAPIVPCDHEALIPELLHDLDEIARHLAKTEVDIIRTCIGQRAVAIAAQIGKNEVVLLRELSGDLVPAGVILRIAMHEQ
jgi:hypothetical protein